MSDTLKRLGDILEEAGMEVTFTGWKSEYEAALKKIEKQQAIIAEMQEALEKTSDYIDELLLYDEAFPDDWDKARKLVVSARAVLSKLKGERDE